MGTMRNEYTILVGKYEWKRPLRTPMYKMADNIKMYIKQIWCQGFDWINLAQDRVLQWDFMDMSMYLLFKKERGIFYLLKFN
jgi:hypothetical protein